jgi:hypothetical protein
MNERIRELMEQAGLYDFVIESMGINEEMEKFAELIEKNHNVSDVYLVGKADGRLEAIYECIEYLRNCGDMSRVIDLKEHFGVEK